MGTAKIWFQGSVVILFAIGTLFQISLAEEACKSETINPCKKITHRFLKSGWKSGSVAIVGHDGKVEWEIKSSAELSDSWLLPNGNVIYSHSDGVTLVSQDKKVIWTYNVPSGKETHSCQPLPNGNFVIGETGLGAWVIELNSKGKIDKKIKVSDFQDPHKAFRHVRKTPDGTYLACIMAENTAYEWDSDGKLIRTFPNGRFVAIRLPNGNTLTSGNPEEGCHISEFDPDGKMIWSLTEEDESEIGITVNTVNGLHRLPNGNTVVGNIMHGKNHSDPDAPQAFEITPDKKIVWTLKDPTLNRTGSIQILDINANPLKLQVLR
jgi:hypothetical protein